MYREAMMPAPAEDLARPHELGYFDLSETYSVLGTALSHRKPERHFISSSPLRAPIEPVAASPVYKVSFRAQYWPTSQPKPLTISPIKSATTRSLHTPYSCNRRCTYPILPAIPARYSPYCIAEAERISMAGMSKQETRTSPLPFSW